MRLLAGGLGMKTFKIYSPDQPGAYVEGVQWTNGRVTVDTDEPAHFDSVDHLRDMTPEHRISWTSHNGSDDFFDTYGYTAEAMD